MMFLFTLGTVLMLIVGGRLVIEERITLGALIQFNQYLLYTINPCWQANLRAEWLRDEDGVRVAGPGNIPTVRAWAGNGFVGNFYEITGGLNWRPTKNWLIRPEVRYGASSRIDCSSNPSTHNSSPTLPSSRFALR